MREGAARQAALPFPVPHHAGNSPIPNGNMLRKVQCDFGWDWNIALAPFGIYGAARLEPRSAVRIAEVTLSQEHGPDGVGLRVWVDAVNAERLGCRIAVGPESREAVIFDGGCEALFQLPDHALWWPNGLGPATLHEVRVEVGGARWHKRLALRDVRLVTEPDAAGLGFKLSVNGRDVFARGANWIPADALPGRITDAAVRDLLQSAAAANMNMIRVWGGGRYERDLFYETCDELGLMVWQDFMFACNLYPATPRFLDSVAAEVREQVRRLAPHVALWCGDNELIGALGWYDESRRDRDRYLVTYDRLNRTIETALRSADRTRQLVALVALAGADELWRCLARRQLGRHACLVGLARGAGFRALPRPPPPLLQRVRVPVLSVDGRDPDLRRAEGLEHRQPGLREPPEERRRQCPDRRDDVPLLPLARAVRRFRLAEPAAAGAGDQDRGDALARR